MCKPPYPASLGNLFRAFALLGLLPWIAATAEAQSGLYLAADLGLARGSTSEFTSDVSSGDMDFDSGLVYSVAAGVGLLGLRVEGEATWERTDVDAIEYDRLNLNNRPITGSRVNRINDRLDLDGTRTTVGLMANAWYDFDLGMGLAPYLGGGLGVNYVRYDIDLPEELSGSLAAQLGLPPSSARVLNEIGGESGDWVFAYQVGAGLGYRLRDSLVLHVGYRYMGATDSTPDWNYGAPVEAEMQNHVFRAGVRLGF